MSSQLKKVGLFPIGITLPQSGVWGRAASLSSEGVGVRRVIGSDGARDPVIAQDRTMCPPPMPGIAVE